MEEEIRELKEEINLLTKKVELLEKSEKKRKAFSYVKVTFKVLSILVLIYSIYWGYQYVINDLPGVIEEKIKDVIPIHQIM